MAQKVEVTLVDDVDGGRADETVTFGLDGTHYEIDLTKANAEKLRKELARFVSAARKTGTKRQSSRTTGPGRKATGGPSSHEVRQWAKEHGIQVNERGRISSEVMVKFQEAQAS